MDEWDEVRGEWLSVAREYRKTLSKSNHVGMADGFGENWVSSTCVLSLADAGAARAERALAAQGIETRRWWGMGAHLHPATESFPRACLRTTEDLGTSTLAVPFYRDLDTQDIQRVAECLIASTAESAFL